MRRLRIQFNIPLGPPGEPISIDQDLSDAEKTRRYQ